MDYALHIAVMLCFYAILACSFNLLIGLAGLFALSLAAFYACGAYVSGILATQFGVPFPLTTLASAVVATGIGAGAALPALRVGGHYLVIVTLALQVIVVDVLLNAKSLTGGTEGISGIPHASLFGWELRSPGQFLVLAVPAAALCFWFARRLAASPAGRALRAMRENEMAAQSVGKNIVALKLSVFAISSALAAIAGSLLAHYISYISPGSFSVQETITVLAMVVLGGAGNLWGSVAGAAILVLLPEALKFVSLPAASADLIRNMLYGVILIVILRVRPQGLFPEATESHLLAPWKAGANPVADIFRAGVLSGRGLIKRFGGITAVNNLDIELRPGEIVGLIGPNGAGKTTAFNLLTGFLPPTAGEVRYRGLTLNGLKPHQIVHAGVARSFQDLKLFRHMTVLENVLVALPHQYGDRIWAVFLRPGRVKRDEMRNISRAREILDAVGLGERAEHGAADLSYAEEKLLVIARLLATGAEAILLDEPLSGLDPTTIARLMPAVRKLAESGRTVCIIEHNLDVIRGLCDTAIYLDEGRNLATGTPDELIANPELAKRYFQ